MADEFSSTGTGLASPAANAAELTPADGADLAYSSRGLYVGGAGNVRVQTVGGSVVTFVAVPAGSILPVRVKRVYATGTTATSIMALW